MTALKKEIKHLHTEADRYVQEIVELKKEILKCQASKRVLCERLVYVDAYLEEAGGFDQLRGDIAIELSMPTDDTPFVLRWQRSGNGLQNTLMEDSTCLMMT